MAKRKKNNLNLILIMLALVVGTWIAADYYFNIYRQPQKEAAPAQEALLVPPVAKPVPVVSQTPATTTAGSAFELQTYRDDRFGFEFQYPVAVKDNAQCPKIEKTGDGLNLGMFSFSVSDKSGELVDFIASELQGMSVDSKKTITVGGVPAIKADYQTTGMGWYGSDAFIERNNKFFEFGLLANESSQKCGGVEDYEDKVYQSVISTLKFVN